MSTFNFGVAAVVTLVFVVGVVVYATLAGTLRVIRGDGRLRLAEMLRRQGSTPEQAFDFGGYQAAAAVRRCMMCAHKVQCDEWSGAKRGIETYCPNANFIARVVTSR
jgi:hypothetical protein